MWPGIGFPDIYMYLISVPGKYTTAWMHIKAMMLGCTVRQDFLVRLRWRRHLWMLWLCVDRFVQNLKPNTTGTDFLLNLFVQSIAQQLFRVNTACCHSIVLPLSPAQSLLLPNPLTSCAYPKLKTLFTKSWNDPFCYSLYPNIGSDEIL